MSPRARLRRLLDQAAKKIFPDHWSFLLGELAMASMAVLFATGIVLALFYDASGESTTYDGSYEPLRGVEMSRSYESVLRLSFDVRAGLVLRQTHHWAALVFIAAVMAHAARMFFTGAFRRPRRLNYSIGVTLLAAAIATGFFGASLPDDMLSAMGARVAYATALSVPVVGPGVAELLAGGEFGGPQMLYRFWLLHVFVLPTVILGLFSIHMVLVWRQTHTQFPSEGPAHKVVGSSLLPNHALKTAAVFAAVIAVLLGLGALVQIHPVWIFGPFEPAAATVPSGPDWYLMYVEGGLRILPDLNISLGPVQVPSSFLIGVVAPSMLFVGLYAWPFIEEWITGDRTTHHVLERPRDRPGRTAVGVAGISVFVVLSLAANHDYLGGLLGVGIVTMTTAFRVLLVVVPVVAGLIAWWVARELASMEPVPQPPDADPPASSEPSLGSSVGAER